MSDTATIRTDACCDCGDSVDNGFAKCPRCGGARCRKCDVRVGQVVIDFMIQTRTMAPVEAEYCEACYRQKSTS